MTKKSILDRICEEAHSEDPDNEVKRVIARWKDHDFTVKVNGEWQIEGFIMWLKRMGELARAVDPSFPKRIPPLLLNPINIAKMLGLPVEEFAEYLPDVNGHVVEELGGFKREVARLSGALEQAMPLIEDRAVLDSSRLNDTQSFLYEATDDTEALSGQQICSRAGVKHSGYTRGLISQMVKDGFLRKVHGGYVREKYRHLP